MLLDEKTPLPIKEVNFNKGVDVDVYDIAVIVVEPHSLEIKALELADASVLDEVLVIGYPPIAGFDTIQIAETASIGSYLKAVQKSSIGQVVAESQKYFAEYDHFLINARVKGGNSGGPVLNREGRTCF